MKIRVPLMKNALVPLAATSLHFTLRLTTSTSAADAGINQNIENSDNFKSRNEWYH